MKIAMAGMVPGAALLSALAVCSCAGPGPAGLPGPRVRVFETGPLHIDRIYPSMLGPYDHRIVDTADLDWVSAYRTEVVEAGSGKKLSDEYFCHSQLQLLNTTRLMVTATGSEEIRFPEGFAMPVTRILDGLPADQRPTRFLGMVLNNHRPDIDLTARIRATVEYRTDEDVGNPPRIKKLFKVGLAVGVDDAATYKPEDTFQAGDDVTTHCVLLHGMNTHWVVPPGTQRVRTTYADFLPVDARVHYAVVHLHNYGRWLRLNDRTTGETLWRTEVEYEPDRVQIARIPVYSSAMGFPIHKDHTYEVEAFYDNTSGHDVDAMALIDLYYNPQGNVDITYPTGPS
jgi:hypothetical protein